MSPLTLTRGTRLGPYEILSALGAGGMGEVYRAHDTSLKRQVAIKVLPQTVATDPERLARFQREAEVLAVLNHPNIAHIHGLEKSDGTIALVMELVEGPTLADRIAQGAIPMVEALPIAKQIAEALEAAHEQGIIHRDLKPANIKVRADGTVKVLDFGLAKAMDPAGASSANAMNSPTISMHATQAGAILGTAAYMSPEQAKGKQVDARADVWAFGAVLYEMLTGTRAFAGEDISDTMVAVLSKDPDWARLPGGTPPRMRDLLRRCLERDAKRRLQAIGEARIHLDDLLSGKSDPATPPETAPVSAPRRVVPVAIATLLGGALVATLAMWVLMRPAPLPLTRLSVDLGPDAVADPYVTVAISPDGRRLVFPIRGASGTPQLATRLLDQATPTALPGTENARSPFFSPDGQWIAFGAEGKLKKTSVLGGAVVVVCDAIALRGGSWGEDGTIVATLSGTTGTGLSRIPSSGGTPQPLATPVNGELTYRWPQILPGGQAVLFTASTTNGVWEDAAIQVLAVKTGQVTTVAKGGYFGRYLSGRLTYVHQGVLLGVPFDLARLAVRGTPVPLLDDIAGDPASGGGQLDVSQSGTLVYRSGQGASQGYPVVWLDSAGKTQSLLPKPGNYQTPRVSPDGQRLALAMDAGKGLDIYAYDSAHDALSRLTFNGHSNHNPFWTADGKHLVYGSDVDKTIMWVRADGAGEAQRLLESKNPVTLSSFSDDGRYLSYYEIAPDTKADSWILPVDASDPEHPKPGKPEVFLKTPAQEGLAVFSPDGRWMSYTSDETGRFELYVRPFHNAVGGKWQISTTGGIYSFWSRAGRLYYTTLDARIMVVEYTVGGDSFSAGKPRAWSETPGRVTAAGFPSMDLAPDGKRFAVLPSAAVKDEKGSVHVTFLLNFFDELKRLVP